jgi:hypothetical protein
MKLLTGKQCLAGFIEYDPIEKKYSAVERHKNPIYQKRKYIESKINEWIKSSQETLKSI